MLNVSAEWLWLLAKCIYVEAPSSLLSLFALLWKYVVIQSSRHENQKGVSDIFGEMDGYIYIYIYNQQNKTRCENQKVIFHKL